MKRTILALALAAASAVAFGDITFNGLGPYYETATISGHTSGTFYCGLLNFTDGSNSCGLGTNFNTICVDLDHEIGGGASWGADCLDSNTQGGGLQLAGNIIASYYGLVTTNEQASGLQLAAWEAVYDGGLTADFSNGNFVVNNASSGALAWAALYYDTGSVVPGNAHYLRPADGSGGQGQMGMPMAPVPEPATLAVLGLGVMAMRRRKKTATR